MRAMRAALALGLAALTDTTSTEDADIYFEPRGHGGGFIMRDSTRQCRTGIRGKGKRRAKNKLARKMRRQQRRRS